MAEPALQVNQQPQQLSKTEIRSKVINLAAPAVAELLLQTLIGMINMIMVGHIGPAAIAAVGLTNQPMFFSLAIFQALNVGTTALVARSIGAKQPERANEALRQTLILTFAMGTVISIIMSLGARTVLVFMGAQDDTLGWGVRYAQIIALSQIFNTIQMSINAALRGAGDTKTPMQNNMASVIIDVIGNAILINGLFGAPKLYVMGSAIATSLGRMFACGMALYVVFAGKSKIKLTFKDKYRFDTDLMSRIVKVGMPAAVEQFILRGGQVLFVRAVSSLGTVTYAAHQVAVNIVGLSFMPGQGFGMAATSLVGQNLGAKRPDQAEECGWETRRLGMFVSGAMAAVFFIFGPQIARLYTNDPDVIRQSALALKIIAIVQPSQSTQFILAGALRGAGDTRWPLYSTFIGVWGFRVLLSWVFVAGLHWGLVGAWAAMALDQFARSFIIHYRYKSGAWKKARV